MNYNLISSIYFRKYNVFILKKLNDAPKIKKSTLQAPEFYKITRI